MRCVVAIALSLAFCLSLSGQEAYTSSTENQQEASEMNLPEPSQVYPTLGSIAGRLSWLSTELSKEAQAQVAELSTLRNLLEESRSALENSKASLAQAESDIAKAKSEAAKMRSELWVWRIGTAIGAIGTVVGVVICITLYR